MLGLYGVRCGGERVAVVFVVVGGGGEKMVVVLEYFVVVGGGVASVLMRRGERKSAQALAGVVVRQRAERWSLRGQRVEVDLGSG